MALVGPGLGKFSSIIRLLNCFSVVHVSCRTLKCHKIIRYQYILLIEMNEPATQKKKEIFTKSYQYFLLIEMNEPATQKKKEIFSNSCLQI